MGSPSKWPRERWRGSQVPSHRWYGQQLCRSRRGPRMAPERSLHRLSMLYDADRCRGVSFNNPPGRNSDAIAIGYGRRCGGSVGQSRRHDQEGGGSIVEEAGPRRARQDPSHQDCCSRSAARCAPEYGHPRRSVVCTRLCTAERLAHSRRTRQNEWRARQSERRSELRGVGPVHSATGSPRARYSDEWYLSPPHRVGELVRKASTHRYLSFDAMTEHIASEMRLVLRSDKGKAGVCSAELASTCRPLAAPFPPVRPLPNGVGSRGQLRS
jgi:hypothetical protein